MIIDVMLVGSYLFMMGVVGGAISYRMRIHKDREEAMAATILGGVFWPGAIALIMVYLVGRGFYRVCLVAGRSYGYRVHAQKIERAQGQMLEEDLGRVGGNMDLLINYDYRPCQRCYGSGCAECLDSGVVRVKRDSAGRYAD